MVCTKKNGTTKQYVLTRKGYFSSGNLANNLITQHYILIKRNYNFSNIAQSSVADPYSYNLAYGNGKYVYVGQNTKLIISTDGENWTQETNNISMNDGSGGMPTFASCYGDNQFVIIPSSLRKNVNGDVYTSPDGLIWTKYDSAIEHSMRIFKGLVYDGSYYIALTEGGYITSTYSSPSSGWSSLELISDLSGYTWTDLTFGNGKYIAIGYKDSVSYIAYTSNLTNWTIVQINGLYEGSIKTNICYGDNFYIAVGYKGAYSISTDGINWTTPIQNTELINSYPYGGIVGVVYNDSNNEFVFVGSSASPDCIFSYKYSKDHIVRYI